ncbi:hypothetical protein FS749_003891 [Ceratobasidium sp. UAMH 11750]|nr:hypothetical protein FS749_003891 [Ceratobasidium sp. UAMH 11750]
MLMISRWSQQPHLPSYYAKPSSSVTELSTTSSKTCASFSDFSLISHALFCFSFLASVPSIIHVYLIARSRLLQSHSSPPVHRSPITRPSVPGLPVSCVAYNRSCLS